MSGENREKGMERRAEKATKLITAARGNQKKEWRLGLQMSVGGYLSGGGRT